MFHNTTPDLQDQDQNQDRFFWSRTRLVLRPTTVSDHITVRDPWRSQICTAYSVDILLDIVEPDIARAARRSSAAGHWLSAFVVPIVGRSRTVSLSVLTAIFQVNQGYPVFIEGKDDGGGGDN